MLSFAPHYFEAELALNSSNKFLPNICNLQNEKAVSIFNFIISYTKIIR